MARTSSLAKPVVDYRKLKEGETSLLNEGFALLMCFRQSSVKIKRAPNILALHLKRFKYIWNDSGVFMRKLSYRINFGSQLKLFNMSEDSETPDRLYELFAVLVHIGG